MSQGQISEIAQSRQLARGIVVDFSTHAVVRDGVALPITEREFAVLEAIVAADGQVVTVGDLVKQIWGDTTRPVAHFARIAVFTLRQKLGRPTFIEAVNGGAGYRLRQAN